MPHRLTWVVFMRSSRFHLKRAVGSTRRHSSVIPTGAIRQSVFRYFYLRGPTSRPSASSTRMELARQHCSHMMAGAAVEKDRPWSTGDCGARAFSEKLLGVNQGSLPTRSRSKQSGKQQLSCSNPQQKKGRSESRPKKSPAGPGRVDRGAAWRARAGGQVFKRAKPSNTTSARLFPASAESPRRTLTPSPAAGPRRSRSRAAFFFRHRWRHAHAQLMLARAQGGN
jgi:hypothetical protein